MLSRFTDYINQQHLFSQEQEVLLAVSGGIDSVALTHLMHQAHYRFAIAHCNFHLRPGDCDRDEQYVRQLAENYGADCHVVHFDTQDYARRHQLSIEEAARHLRYDYFEQLCQSRGYAVVATAHHRDDSTETFFLNLLRGTGIAGLHGIRPQQGRVVRPLLPFGRDDIETYARQQGLTHVEDVTNASVQYKRNQIRHLLMPLLRQLAPAIDRTMQQNIRRISATEQLYSDYLELLRQRCVQSSSHAVTIDLSLLPEQYQGEEKFEIRRTLLYEFLSPYGFNASVVDNLMASQRSGREFFSATHRLVTSHQRLEVVPLYAVADSYPAILIETISVEGPAEPIDFRSLPSNQAYFDAQRVLLPLRLRHWQPADRFQPFGMTRGTRLLSDFFSDLHLSLPEKEQQLLLVDASDRILWVVGLRTDHSVRVTPSTTTLLKVVIK